MLMPGSVTLRLYRTQLLSISFHKVLTRLPIIRITISLFVLQTNDSKTFSINNNKNRQNH